VSNHTALTWLSCSDNPLNSLNVSGCTALIALYCSDNQLNSLNVNNCTALAGLDCSGNRLGVLNVGGCTALTELSCGDNQLSAAALNQLFTDLSGRSDKLAGHLSIESNPGTATCNRGIAAAKNWNVKDTPGKT
jgi:hypothetical protein